MARVVVGQVPTARESSSATGNQFVRGKIELRKSPFTSGRQESFKAGGTSLEDTGADFRFRPEKGVFQKAL